MKTDGKILPLPVMSVEKRLLKDKEMAVVTVSPSDMPPVKYNGRIWIRTGPRRAVAGEQDERILIEKRRYKNIPYDLYPVHNAGISDLSRVVFEQEYLPGAFAPDVLEENNRTYEERLASCRMIVSPGDTTPTIHGLLAIGKNPLVFLPGAYIQFLRIDGTMLHDAVIDEEKIGGAISELIRRTMEKLKAHNRRAVDVTTGGVHKITESFPLAAVEQILYNAVLHRTYENTNAPVRVHWYNDRIEIISPGGTYGNVTPDNLGQPGVADYRNPNLGATMKILGFVQAFGRGIAIARNEMKRNGNPEPEFTANQSIVSCVLRMKI
jgi:ATP-dependent DNA helicase RecG